MPRPEWIDEAQSFYRAHLDLWQRAKLAGQYVAIAKPTPRVLGFYMDKDEAWNLAPSMLEAGESIMVWRISGW